MSSNRIQDDSNSIQLRRKGGRPKKHATDEERKRAKQEQDRKRQAYNRQLKRRRVIPVI